MTHKFTAAGEHFVHDVESGAIHIVPPELYNEIDKNDESRKYSADIKALQAKGLLFSPETKITIPDSEIIVKALCLHIAHDCNLRCKYCFAHTGDFGGNRSVMSINTAKSAIDWLIKMSGNRRNLEIDFFGGEPLMGWSTVVATVEYARSIENCHDKNFRFTITTNGLLLDDGKTDFINREMSNVVLSLDGRKSVNDSMRPTSSGCGSYDLIVPKFQKLIAKRRKIGKDYYIRGTFTAENLDFANDVEAIAALGFDQLSVEPVVTAPSQPYAIREEHIPTIEAEYDRLLDIMLSKPADKRYNFFHFMLDFDAAPCAIKRLRGCGSGCEYVAITPEGDIYPCHQFAGQDRWKMGNLHTGEFDRSMAKDFSKAILESKQGCPSCPIKYYCSGGCNANNFFVNNNINIPYETGCKLQKKRIECAIAYNSLR